MSHWIPLHFVLLGLSIAALTPPLTEDCQPASTASSAEVILPAIEANKLLPDTFFFRGEQMFVESRNSEGILFPDGMHLLTSLLDASGRPTDINEEYLACLLTEVPLNVNGHELKPGVYGIGLDVRHRFVMMDIAAHRIFIADSERDSRLFRARPLQILSGSRTHSYRLYLGRNFVSLSRAIGGAK